MNLHIHAPPGFTYRGVQWCPMCKCRRRFVVTLYEWHDACSVCCACGCVWSDIFVTDNRKTGRAARAREAAERWRSAPPRVGAVAALMAHIEEARKAS